MPSFYVLLYWIPYWIEVKVLQFPANQCNWITPFATACKTWYNTLGYMGSAFAAAGGRHPAKLDTLGVTGSSPVAPTSEQKERQEVTTNRKPGLQGPAFCLHLRLHQPLSSPVPKCPLLAPWRWQSD